VVAILLASHYARRQCLEVDDWTFGHLRNRIWQALDCRLLFGSRPGTHYITAPFTKSGKMKCHNKKSVLDDCTTISI
jgi:hypothetical protein